MSITHTFSLDLRINDPEKVYTKAVEVCRADGMTGQHIDDILMPGGEVDVNACLQMIVDPGQIPGCTIYGGQVTTVPADL